MLTDTAASNTATPAATGSGKINSNRSLTKEGPDATPRSPSDPDVNITLTDSSGGSDGKSDYVESTRKSPMILAITQEPSGKIRELELMHEVSKDYINAMV